MSYVFFSYQAKPIIIINSYFVFGLFSEIIGERQYDLAILRVLKTFSRNSMSVLIFPKDCKLVLDTNQNFNLKIIYLSVTYFIKYFEKFVNVPI